MGFQTVEHETTVPGASNSLKRMIRLQRLQVTVISREPDRNSALTFTLRFKGKDDNWPEVIWPTPQWRIDPVDMDEHLDMLISPINVEREHTVAGVLFFEPMLPPVDESVAPKLDVFDHVSRARVRMSAQIGNYDRRSWERVRRDGRASAWWSRVLEREERYHQRNA